MIEYKNLKEGLEVWVGGVDYEYCNLQHCPNYKSVKKGTIDTIAKGYIRLKTSTGGTICVYATEKTYGYLPTSRIFKTKEEAEINYLETKRKLSETLEEDYNRIVCKLKSKLLK